MIEFVNPWRVCPGCHQYYQNELRIDIASKFVSFVRGQYPHDTRRQVNALNVMLRALNSMLERLTLVQKREIGDTANEMLSLIDQMKGDASPLPKRYSQFESDAFGVHGRIALYEGTEESARKAVAHFEKALKVSEAIGDAEYIAIAKANVAAAKSINERDNNHEELRASQELYELRIAKLGEEHENTINAGRGYALNLQDANRRDEARELLTKLLATSKQVFGPHHNTTKEVTSALTLVIKVANQD
jgi:tetratricopeptide (TPR) repeat protein